MRTRISSIFLLLPAMAACERLAIADPPGPPATDASLRQEIARWGVYPIGAVPVQHPGRVALGRMLFFDPILSGNRDVACATCHHPATGLGDGLGLAIGTGAVGNGPERVPGPGRTVGPRHTPSLLNIALGLFYHFWDGRLASLGRSSPPAVVPGDFSGPGMLAVLNRHEMRGAPGDVDVSGEPNELAGMDDGEHGAIWQALMQRLLALEEYRALFAAAFPGVPPELLTFRHAAMAIAGYMAETFTKIDTRFDRFLNRDEGALTAAEKRGARLFFGNARCAACHGGPLLGGTHFSNIGAPQIGPGLALAPPLDMGRAEVQDLDFNRFAFRVPPLRNVELTAPYMHSGAYATLEAVVRHYTDIPQAQAEYDASQLAPLFRGLHHGDPATVHLVLSRLDARVLTPIELTDGEVQDLVTFLKALTDPAARDLRSLIPTRVPSGLPVPE